MNNAQRKAMRREQMERWLATDGMSVEEWCKLNRMSTSTFYLWLNKFRDEDPATFGRRPAPGWVEVAKESRKGSVALAVIGDACEQAIAAGPGVSAAGVEAAPAARGDADGAVPIRISANGIGIEFPHGADAGDLAAVLKAAMSL